MMSTRWLAGALVAVMVTAWLGGRLAGTITATIKAT